MADIFVSAIFYNLTCVAGLLRERIILIGRRVTMKELDVVRLVRDFNGLPAGTEGTIVLEYDGTAYEVEFVDFEGETIDVLTTPADMIAIVEHL